MKTTRSGWALGAQLNLFMVIAIVTPVVALIALSAYLITSANSATDATANTLLWMVTLVVGVIMLLAVAGALLRMRIVTRNHLLGLAQTSNLPAAPRRRGPRGGVHGTDREQRGVPRRGSRDGNH